MTHGTRWLRLLAVTALLLAALGTGPAARAAANDYYVNTTQDLAGTCAPNAPYSGGVCSLRRALNAASASGTGSRVLFSIPDTDAGYSTTNKVWTITLAGNTGTQLLLSGNGVIVDGTSQAVWRSDTNPAGPEIMIDGQNIPQNEGFVVTGNDNTVKGLGFIKFGRVGSTVPGIQVNGDRNTIQGNFVGIDQLGKNAAGNRGPGIKLTGTAEDNIVGGNIGNDDETNVISGNGQHGIWVDGGARNIIRGNFIGTDQDGIAAVPNADNGILIDTSSADNIIGTDPTTLNPSYRNIISGNPAWGVLIRNAAGNKVYGNRIGLDKNGTTRIPNIAGGVQVDGPGQNTSDNIIGAPSTNDILRNVIAGNTGPGVSITGQKTFANTVQSNYIGLNLNGQVPTGGATSQTVGVEFSLGANDNTVGGDNAGARNVIAGNGGDGVRVLGDSSPNVLAQSWFNNITGNYIGVGPNGSTPIPNTGSGVYVGTWASFTRVGGPTPGEANLIARNGQHGVILASAELSTTNILNNQILANTLDGVQINGSITTNVLGDTIQGNGGNGVTTTAAPFVTVAGNATDARSSITANGGDGIHATDGVSLTVRFIDTTPVGRPNGGDGIDATDDTDTRILDSTITKNTGLGIRLTGTQVVHINGTDLSNKNLITENRLGGALLTDVYSATLTYNDLSTNGSALVPSDGLAIVRGNIIVARLNSVTGNFGTGVNVTSTLFLRFESDSDGTANRVVGNRRGGLRLTTVTSATLRFNTVNNNYDDGIRVEGGSDDVVITRNRVQLNGPQNATGGVCAAFTNPALERTVAGQGVSVRGNTTKHVRIVRNSFTRNCGLAILREPNTTAGSNQGIQPPSALTLSKLSPTTAIVTGRVAPGGVGGCPGCTVELYEADPSAPPDGEGLTKLNVPADYVIAFDELGNFSFQLSRIPKQLLATATDKFGNTSEFGVFTATYGIDIAPNRAQNAYPTQVITYFHTVTNIGTVGDTFALSVDTPQGWSASPLPPGPFSLPAGKSIPVTVTLKLPPGTALTARANTKQDSFVRVTAVYSSAITDYVTDTTTVDPKVVIDVSPLTSNGEVQATKTITYAHQITNLGNITATVNLSFNSTPFWPTVVNTNTLTLLPGESRTLTVSVTPPNGTQQGTTAQTIINLNVPLDASQNKVLTDTTKVVVTPRVTITPPVVNGDGAADKTTKYTDFIVLNNSNGTTRFRLVGLSTFGSVVTFSTVGGIPLDSGNRFTLGTTPSGNPSNQLQLEVDVRLPRIIPTGAIDVTTIQVLDDATGAVLAVAQARTTVRVGRTIIYLPIVVK